jgi:hypothetical protein
MAAAVRFVFSTIPLFGGRSSLNRRCSPALGETKSVTGKVLRVKAGAKGVHVVDFCEDQMSCPFTVLVFPCDLKDVGDVRPLVGRVIEIHGPVKLDNGRAEIILNRVSQRTGGSTLMPPLPKNYDVEKQGHHSVGSIPPAKKPVKTKATSATSGTYGNEADVSESRRSELHHSFTSAHTITSPHTMPLRSSSSGYFVPRQMMPSFHSA